MGHQSQYDFETFYHGVCAELSNKGEVQNMSKQFSLLGDDNERVKFILEKNLTKRSISPVGNIFIREGLIII